jgi:hypothetical protein
MNRIFRVLLAVICFEMGAMLLYLPWTGFWEQNYFLFHHPVLMPFFLHPSFRGVISGIGLLDVFLAFSLIASRNPAGRVPPRQ